MTNSIPFFRFVTSHLHAAALTALAALLLGAVTPAAAADSSFYVNGKLGSTDVEQSFDDTAGQLIEGDEDAFALELGFQFNKYLGVQVGYHDFGAAEGLICFTEDCVPGTPGVVVLEAETKAYSAAGVVRLPLPLGFAIFGKAGVAFFETEIDAISDGGVSQFVDDFSDEDLILGVGASFDLPGPLRVFAEWEQLASDLETVSLGLTLTF